MIKEENKLNYYYYVIYSIKYNSNNEFRIISMAYTVK